MPIGGKIQIWTEEWSALQAAVLSRFTILPRSTDWLSPWGFCFIDTAGAHHNAYLRQVFPTRVRRITINLRLWRWLYSAHEVHYIRTPDSRLSLNGGPGRTRTYNARRPRIYSPLRYQFRSPTRIVVVYSVISSLLASWRQDSAPFATNQTFVLVNVDINYNSFNPRRTTAPFL